MRKAKARGATDYIAGTVIGDNPYPENDARHWAWIAGWLFAAKQTNSIRKQNEKSSTHSNDHNKM